MVPYSQLPDSEKRFDREMAMNTIKLLKKLGYDLIKREETELYKVLKQRIQNSDEEFQCQMCKHAVSKYQVYCDSCGHKLDIDWGLYKEQWSMKYDVFISYLKKVIKDNLHKYIYHI